MKQGGLFNSFIHSKVRGSREYSIERSEKAFKHNRNLKFIMEA
jgi:hypothetical protein